MPEPPDETQDFERLLRETYRMVLQIAYSVLSNAADAEEVTQDAFWQAYRRRSSLRDPKNFRAWVGRVAWRLALNRRRSILRSVRRDGDWLAMRPQHTDGESEAQAREFAAHVERHIARLPEKLRAVLLLSAIEDLDAASIGAILRIPEGTVRSRLHLARRQLLKEVTP
jgi:RNA polymerase sigma-70 factor (ECF subfamily)